MTRSGEPGRDSHVDVAPSMKAVQFFLAGLLLVRASEPDAREPSTFVKPGQLQCVASLGKSLEQVLDAPDATESMHLARAAVMRGQCLVGPEAQVVDDLEERVTPANRPYICFHALFLNEKPKNPLRMCSPAVAVTTIASARAQRTGDFKITTISPHITVAECTEGGVVALKKTGSGWIRLATQVFPQSVEPTQLAAPLARDQSLRQGCKGDDYKW